MEEKIIEKFRESSLDQLKALKAADIVLLDEAPIQENITIVAKPPKESIKKISKLISELKLLDSNQFFYPVERLHLTILGNIPVTVDIKSHLQSIKSVLMKQEIAFKLYGIGSNQADNYSRILEFYEYVGWINYMRYLEQPQQSFLDKLFAYKDTVFGVMPVSKVQIFRTTSKTIDSQQSTLISEFDL